MAARTVKIRHDEETRSKIKTSQLLNRLNNHIFKDVEVSVTQLKAIEILLRKTLPDLSAVTVGGDPDNPVEMIHKITREIIDPQHPNGEGIPATSESGAI